MKIGFIGLGLIGGSIARAVRYFYPDTEIIAHSRTRASVEQAVADGVINRIIDQIDEDFSDCTYIFLCAPVSSNAKYLEQLKPLIGPDCIITDVGSTKTDIHEKVTALDMEANFIGGHPMAGSEKTGYANSKRILIGHDHHFRDLLFTAHLRDTCHRRNNLRIPVRQERQCHLKYHLKASTVDSS